MNREPESLWELAISSLPPTNRPLPQSPTVARWVLWRIPLNPECQGLLVTHEPSHTSES